MSLTFTSLNTIFVAGPAFERPHDARRTYDPDGLLTPGYEIFPERR